MSETVKLIVEIPKEYKELLDAGFCGELRTEAILHAVQNGIPLDDVKAEIETDLSGDMFDEYGNETALHKELMEILDNIGKGE